MDCLLFLLRGVVFIQGQGLLVEASYAYVVKDEGISGDVEGEPGCCSQKAESAVEQGVEQDSS